jgi:hypothetical protein
MATSGSFKKRPSPDQLRTMERELCFVPSQTLSPTELTQGQISNFNEHGYIKGHRLFGVAAVACGAPHSVMERCN